MVTRTPLLRRPVVLALIAVGAVLAVVALALFQPWKLVVDERVAEALPTAAPAAPAPPAAPTAPEAAAEPVVLARGELIAHEHESSGSVLVLELPDGSRVLRLEDLDTSNGPDLQVWITDAPVIAGRDGWHVFDDGSHVDLGELKGNIGSSNYPLPPEVDLAQLSSVSIWCQRFAVSFAAAALEPVAS
jgi:hypothetical protein